MRTLIRSSQPKRSEFPRMMSLGSTHDLSLEPLPHFGRCHRGQVLGRDLNLDQIQLVELQVHVRVTCLKRWSRQKRGRFRTGPCHRRWDRAVLRGHHSSCLAADEVESNPESPGERDCWAALRWACCHHPPMPNHSHRMGQMQEGLNPGPRVAVERGLG